MTQEKYRYWWFVAYPDSLPSDWIDILCDTLTPIFVSPLHSRDIDSNGEFKKPHYHILVVYNGPTTFNNIKKHFCEPLNAPIPKYVLNIKGAFEYLTHKNNTDKAQYDFQDIQFLNGADMSYIDEEDNNIINLRTILSIINDNEIHSFRKLVDAIKFDDVLMNVLRNNLHLVVNYLK